MVRLFRVLVHAGIGLIARDGGLDVVAAPGLLTPAIRVALTAHKMEVMGLVDVDERRRAWRIPETSALSPTLITIVAWLTLEWGTFSRADYRLWLAKKMAYINAGVPSHVADLLATEAVACPRLGLETEAEALAAPWKSAPRRRMYPAATAVEADGAVWEEAAA